ncbi:MAG: phage tail protein [Janthinobacterium lividum]
MAIIQAGSATPASTLVAGVYVGIVAPPTLLQGAPTNVLGFVGVGSWGPVGMPVTFGDPSGAVASFGPVTNRTHDLATAATVAALQGATAFRAVRVTDGTDAAATFALPAATLSEAAAFWAAVAAALNTGSGVLRGQSNLIRFNATSGEFSALYTGVVGDGVTVSVSQGSKTGTFRVVVSLSGSQPEVYDNIAAAAGALPTAASYALAGGADGAAGVTSAMLVGADVAPRTGLYALRGQGCAATTLVDMTDPTQFAVLIPFAQAEGAEVYVSGVASETIASAAANKSGAGIDDYSVHVMLGDWLYWSDTANGVIRLVSPAVVAAAKRVALAPNDSILNTPLGGIVGSQKSGTVGSGALVGYSSAEIEELVIAGIDVVGNPSPGGSYWSCLVGHNSSSDASRHSDSYTQMTNFLARTINSGMGTYVGKPNSLPTLNACRATLLALLSTAQSAGLIGDDDGSVPYSVVCDRTNNPDGNRALGITQADVRVRYQGITERLFVNLQGGASVTVG